MVREFEEVMIRTFLREQAKATPKPPPKYAVVLHNDDINGFGFVVEALRRIADAQVTLGQAKELSRPMADHFHGVRQSNLAKVQDMLQTMIGKRPGAC